MASPMDHHRILPLSSDFEAYVYAIGDESEIVMEVPLAGIVQRRGFTYRGKGHISEEQREAKID